MTRLVWALLVLSLSTLPAASGCGAGAPRVAMVPLKGDAATLTYALKVEEGDGRMVRASADAIRQALSTAGYELVAEDKADVVLEADVSDVEKKSFMQITVDGRVQNNREVIVVMRARTQDGKKLDQHQGKLVVTEGLPIEADRFAGLINHFSQSSALASFSLEQQIAKVKGGEPLEEDAP